jgi:hypothetical protein
MASMNQTFEPTKILITVLTYPHPSRRYQELVCTAGVTEAGEWIRLYPIDYRYRPRTQQFRKYQWIEIGLSPYGHSNDNRKESREPDLASMRILGEPLSPADNWRERRKIIDELPTHTVNQLRHLYDTERVSLGVVCPTRILDLKIEPADPEWKPEWQAALNQLKLFGPPPKPLRKIPFKFSYIFECEDSDKPHSAIIGDWELGVLWLKEAERLGDEQKVAESVKNKFLNEICHPDRDTRFFMGTVFPYNTWIVLGVFWPPKVFQRTLF